MAGTLVMTGPSYLRRPLPVVPLVCESIVTETSLAASLQTVEQVMVQVRELWLDTVGDVQAEFPSPVTVTVIFAALRPVGPKFVPASTRDPPKMDGAVVMEVTVGPL